MTEELKIASRILADAQQAEQTPTPDATPVESPALAVAPEQGDIATQPPVVPDEQSVEMPTEEAIQDPETLAQLAEAIGRDPSYLYGIKMPLSEGGDPIPLGEIKDAIQALSRENRELKEKPTTEPAATPAWHQSQQALTAAQAQAAQLAQEYQQVNWAEMQQKEPMQALILRQNFQDANTYIQGQIAQHQKTIQDARQAAQSAVPEWATEREAITQFLQKEYGLSKAQIDSEMSPGQLKLYRDAYKASQPKAPSPVKTSVKPLPPRTNAQPPQLARAKKQAEIIARGRASKRMDDKIRAVIDLAQLE